MFKKFSISILVPGIAVDRETLATKSLGGSESAGLYMARALAREGASVKFFCNTSLRWVDEVGVCYLPLQGWAEFAKGTPHDVCIVQRSFRAFAEPTQARLNLLWCHDVALGRNRQAFREVVWNVDRTIVLSRYMFEQYKTVYGLDDDALLLSHNGIDLETFESARAAGVDRERSKLVYAARPERGLDLLLRHVMPKLLAQDPTLTLHLATYDHPAPDLQPFYVECRRLAELLGQRVVQLGPLSKPELYRHYLSARAYLYPTPSPAHAAFREVSCISAMECQAAGLPIVTTAIGALPETIGDGAGLLIDANPGDPRALSAYVERFVDGVMTLVRDEGAWCGASKRGLARARELDWSNIAREWLGELERLIRCGNDSPERLVRHFCRTSDIVSARRVLADAERELASARRDELRSLLEPWSFLDRSDGCDAQRELIQASEQGRIYETAAQDARLVPLRSWLAEHEGRLATVLDYDCAQGAHAIGLARRLPHLRIHGVDSSAAAIGAAEGWARQLGVAERATFSVWRRGSQQTVAEAARLDGQGFDCALLQQGLERVAEPWSVLESVERQVHRGGKLYLAVAYGPWERAERGSDWRRSQIWQFDSHDLSDMLARKADFSLHAIYAGNDSRTGEPMGWWIATYTADHQPVPPIDIERRLWLQRPTQSVAAAIIAGRNAHETLQLTLRVIENAVDEIVVADCGMSDEGRRLAQQLGVRLVAGVDPYRDGFERARNVALDACSSDWCLWLDADEQLLAPDRLGKYLRNNAYHAYEIAGKVAGRPVLPAPGPVRLFRRRPRDGRSVRFWGALHEKAELGVDEGAGPSLALPDVGVAKLGSNESSAQGRDASVNGKLLNIDRVRYPERRIQKHLIMHQNMRFVEQALSANGGRVDARIRAKCRETIELYRQYFLGRPADGVGDPLRSYSEALAVLQEGFEVVFQVEADKLEAQPNGLSRYRFASLEDFNAELRRAVDEKARRFDSEWW